MALKAQGTILSYTPKAGGEKVPIGGLRSIGELTQTSEEIDVTTLDSEKGYREYMQGFKDGGQLQLGGFFNPASAGQMALNDLFDAGDVVEWEIKFTDGTTVVFDAYVMGNAVGPTEVDGSPQFSATLRVSGPIDITPAAA